MCGSAWHGPQLSFQLILSATDTRLCRTDVPASSRGKKGRGAQQHAGVQSGDFSRMLLLEMFWIESNRARPSGVRTSHHLRGVAEAGGRSQATAAAQVFDGLV